MKQIPLFSDPVSPSETEKKVEQVDPLANPDVVPDFSLFPDSDEILSVVWNAMMGKWVAIYKSDNNKR